MRCEKVQPWLSAVVDEEEIGVWGWWVRAHLARCPACRAELGQLRALEARLVAVAPVERRPIFRPMGLTRPVLAVATLAGAAGYFFWPQPKAVPVVPVAVVTPRPTAKPILAPPEKLPPPVLRPKVARQGRRRRPSLARARPIEQIVVVAKSAPPAQPLTLVHDSRDDDGGTIHIETTIPAAYVAAIQTASLTSGETN